MVFEKEYSKISPTIGTSGDKRFNIKYLLFLNDLFFLFIDLAHIPRNTLTVNI